MRRGAMFVILLSAIVLLFLGATFFDEYLSEHLSVFLLYWGACGWLTVTAILLSIYDLLSLRAKARREEANARKEILGKTSE